MPGNARTKQSNQWRYWKMVRMTGNQYRNSGSCVETSHPTRPIIRKLFMINKTCI